MTEEVTGVWESAGCRRGGQTEGPAGERPRAGWKGLGEGQLRLGWYLPAHWWEAVKTFLGGCNQFAFLKGHSSLFMGLSFNPGSLIKALSFQAGRRMQASRCVLGE